MIRKNGKTFCTSFFLSFPVPCTSQGSVSSWKVEPKNSLSRWYYLELNDNMKNHFIIEHLSNACTFALSLNQKKKIIYRLQDWNHNIYLSFDALRKFLLPKIKTFVRVFINNILQYYNIYIYIYTYIYIYIYVCIYIKDITWPHRDTNFIFECWKYLSGVSEANKWEILSALEDKIHIPKWPCNVLLIL